MEHHCSTAGAKAQNKAYRWKIRRRSSTSLIISRKRKVHGDGLSCKICNAHLYYDKVL
jgi:hypothetical protein